MPKIKWTRAYEKRFAKLPENVKETTYKQLDLLIANPTYPSLRLEKLTEDIWAFSVTMNYRVTFQYDNGDILLRKIGTHDILRHP